MKYSQIRSMDISNGEGVGVSLFVSGCHFHCKNCFNPETWSFSSGNEWTLSVQDEFLDLIDRPYIKRVSILGGSPLADDNLSAVDELLYQIRKRFLYTKQIWLYTGYKWEDIWKESGGVLRQRVVSSCDVLVDGQYVDALRDITLKFRGSSNQRVIDVQKSLQQEEYATNPVLYLQ